MQELVESLVKDRPLVGRKPKFGIVGKGKGGVAMVGTTNDPQIMSLVPGGEAAIESLKERV